jgi:sugar lactone lactonase YvrE
MRCIAGLLILTGCAASADWPVTQIKYQGRTYGGDSVPRLDRDLLFYNSGGHTLTAWSLDGPRVFEAAVSDPDGRPASIASMAMDSGGTIAVAISYQSASGVAGGIAYLDRTGKQTGVFSTGRYKPTHLCFDEKGRLWAFGWQRDAENNVMSDDEPYMLVRRYTADRKEDGRFLPRQLFAGKLNPFSFQGGYWRVQAAKDRIGGLAHPSAYQHQREWVELDLEGNLIGRWPMPAKPNGGYALTRDGRFFVRDSTTNRLFRLDRERGEWIAIEDPPRDSDLWRSGLMGAVGNQLVFAADSGARLLHVDADALAR